jgi:hypothetical protein
MLSKYLIPNKIMMKAIINSSAIESLGTFFLCGFHNFYGLMFDTKTLMT